MGELGWYGPYALRSARLHHAFSGRRSSAQRCVLVAHYGDAKNQFVPNPINRYSVGGRSGLAPNPDGSVDIYIQQTAPAGHESNWLPAPSGKFILWLRAYLPGEAILDGKYMVPPVVEVK